MNTMNILGISEDLQNLIQCDMENQTYQIQRMLADELDAYKGKITNMWRTILKKYMSYIKVKKTRRIKE